MMGLQEYVRTIEAGQSSVIGARGTTIIARDVPGELIVRMRSQKLSSESGQAYQLTMRGSEKWLGSSEFDQVELVNPSTSTRTYRLLIGYGDYDLGKFVASSVPDKFITGQLTYNFVGGDRVQVISQNPARNRLLFYVLSNPEGTPLFFGGDITVDDTNGLSLMEIGQVLPPLESTGEVWIYAASSGAGVRFGWIEEVFT